jgi:spermidine synthase
LPEKQASKIRLNFSSLLLVGLLPFLSGAAALAHELLWTRRLVDILGATDWVTGRVLGLFFLGISIGAYLATFQLRRNIPAVKQLAFAELCIAALALLAAFLPLWTDWIWAALGTEQLVSWQGALVKVLIGIVVVLPPSTAMGFTLPFFIRATAELGHKVSTMGIWVYAINTFGGVFGLWFVSTWLIQWCGAQYAMVSIVALNIFIAGVLWLLSNSRASESLPAKGDAASKRKTRKEKKLKRKLEKDKPRAKPPIGPVGKLQSDTISNFSPHLSRWNLVWLSFLSGFIVLSLEILLIRLTNLVVPSSFHSTSALLANVILLLAISSVLISLLNFGRRKKAWGIGRGFLGSCFLGIALFTFLCPVFLFEWTDKLLSIRYLEGLNNRTIDSVAHYWTLVFWLVASTGGMALLFSGFVFPSLITISSNDDPTGSKIGLLLAANGVGGLLGSEFSNTVLIGWVGIYQAFPVLALVTSVCGVWLLFNKSRVWAFSAVVGFASAFLVIGTYTDIGDLPYISPRSKTQFSIVERVFGREGVLLVVQDPKQSKSILVNGQYLLGSSGATTDQRRQLTIPWLLNRQANSVCSLGLATGISTSGLEDLKSPPAVTAIELSANVERISREHFKDETNGFYDRAENRVLIEDARTFMAAAENEFDLIVGDLYRPHGSGEARLFSVEHFRNIRNALTEDGLFCQWLPAYQLNFENWKTIAATFQHVFSETLVINGNQDASFPMVGLIGRKHDRAWNVDELAACLDTVPRELLDQDPLLKSARKLVVGVLKENSLPGETLNTLDNLKVEIAAGNFLILKDLRKDRQSSFESEFLGGQSLAEFHRRLRAQTTPLRFPVRR